MPLGICESCQRAYIFDGHPDGAVEACPVCGTHLRRTSVREMRDMPPLPLQLLPQGEQDEAERTHTT
jgi:hypothetical protein